MNESTQTVFPRDAYTILLLRRTTMVCKPSMHDHPPVKAEFASTDNIVALVGFFVSAAYREVWQLPKLKAYLAHREEYLKLVSVDNSLIETAFSKTNDLYHILVLYLDGVLDYVRNDIAEFIDGKVLNDELLQGYLTKFNKSSFMQKVLLLADMIEEAMMDEVKAGKLNLVV